MRSFDTAFETFVLCIFCTAFSHISCLLNRLLQCRFAISVFVDVREFSNKIVLEVVISDHRLKRTYCLMKVNSSVM